MKGFSSVPLKFESFVELNQVENCKQKPMPCRALPELRIRLDTIPLGHPILRSTGSCSAVGSGTI